jgi:predicted metal-binding protein
MTIVYAVDCMFSCMRELVVLIQCPEIELWERFVWSHFFGTLENTFGNNKHVEYLQTQQLQEVRYTM